MGSGSSSSRDITHLSNGKKYSNPLYESSTRQLYTTVAPHYQNADKLSASLVELIPRLKIYQHNSSGELLIIIDNDSSFIDEIQASNSEGEQPWYEVVLDKKQNEYLNRFGMNNNLPEKACINKSVTTFSSKEDMRSPLKFHKVDEPVYKEKIDEFDPSELYYDCANENISTGITVDFESNFPCPICNKSFDHLASKEMVNKHVSTCSTTSELRKKFELINFELRPSVDILQDTNRSLLDFYFKQALDQFELRAHLNNEVIRLANRVIDLPHDAAQGKWLQDLREDIQNMINVCKKLLTQSDDSNHSPSNSQYCTLPGQKLITKQYQYPSSQTTRTTRYERTTTTSIEEDEEELFVVTGEGGGEMSLGSGSGSGSGLAGAGHRSRYEELLESLEILHAVRDLYQKKCTLLNQYRNILLDLSDFEFLRIISHGDFAKVYLVKRVEDEKYCAIKVMHKKRLKDQNMYKRVMRERKLMTSMNSEEKLFVNLLCSFQSKDFLFMVMEYVEGGDVLQLLNKFTRLDEKVAKHFILQVCMALDHLHKRGVVHRDVKPDNLLITRDGHIKLMDFGMASPLRPLRKGTATTGAAEDRRDDMESCWQENISVSNSIHSTGSSSSLNSAASNSSIASISSSHISFSFQVDRVEPGYLYSIVGNYNYAAPEMVLGTGYGLGIDWWACGVLLFHLVAGITPYVAETVEQIAENIIANRIDWEMIPESISESCKFLIQDLLVVDVKERIGGVNAKGPILEHPYFNDVDIKKVYDSPGPYIPKISNENETVNNLEAKKWSDEFSRDSFAAAAAKTTSSGASSDMFHSFAYPFK